jgi:hypothetical protein
MAVEIGTEESEGSEDSGFGWNTALHFQKVDPACEDPSKSVDDLEMISDLNW